MPHHFKLLRRHQGSVLIVALVLLGALSALVVSATQSSVLELQMDGNETWHQRATLAAATALAAAESTLAAAPADTTPPPSGIIDIVAMPGDHYSYRIRRIGNDARVFELSGGTRIGTHYTVSASGSSVRNATADIEAGLLLLHDPAGVFIGMELRHWRRLYID